MRKENPKYLFGLLGKKLGHSFSRGYFTKKFFELGIDAAYLNFELDLIGDLESVLEANPNLVGLNVTIPFKEALDVFTSTGAKVFSPIRAANTLVVQSGQIVEVHNTDIVGFKQSLMGGFGEGRGRVLVLGTGGAAKAVEAALYLMEGFEGVDFGTRNPKETNHFSYSQLQEMGIGDYSLIVNTTPLGMHPNVDAEPDLPYSSLHSGQHLFDLVYNPAETRFLERGKAAGCSTQNGLEMLHLQAEAAWEIWKKNL